MVKHDKSKKRKSECSDEQSSNKKAAAVLETEQSIQQSIQTEQNATEFTSSVVKSTSNNITNVPLISISNNTSQESNLTTISTPSNTSTFRILQSISQPTIKTNTSTNLGAPCSSKCHPPITIVLVRAALETVKTKKGYELLTADTHSAVLNKLNKDPALYRPDIVHQCLLTLLDSPLNKAGLLQVYIHSDKNQLIYVNPSIRIPRTFKRFAGLVVQLLHKLKIRSADSQDILMSIIKNPVTQHFPAGSLKLGTSVTGELVNMTKFAQQIGGLKAEECPTPIVFCVGSHASGPAVVDWTEKTISISQYPLSASVALGRICFSFENAWGIL